MNQLAMHFEPARAARRDDPETSHAAARNAARFAESHAGRILVTLQTHGARTAHEIAQLVGLTVVQVDRRLPDLKAAGLADVCKHDDGAAVVVGGFRVWEAT